MEVALQITVLQWYHTLVPPMSTLSFAKTSEYPLRRNYFRYQKRTTLLRARVCLCLLVLQIILTYTCGLLVPTDFWSRCFPRFKREFRRRFLVNWNRQLQESHKREKFDANNHSLVVHVIVLRRLRERSIETVNALDAQHVRWEIQEAVDGLSTVSSSEQYAGKKKLKWLSYTMQFDNSTLKILKDKYDASEIKSAKLKKALHERLRFGCYMSHVTLWRRLLEADTPYLVIFEDDVVISAEFAVEVTARVQRLPDDWDLFYLNGCFRHLGPVFDVGIRQSQGGLCTHGYLISVKGAKKLLARAVLHSDKAIDHVLDHETIMGNMHAFHAEPTLVRPLTTKKSTLAY